MHVSLVGQDYEFILDKSEEQHISFYSDDNVIQLEVQLDGYRKECIPIKFLKKAYEKSYKLSYEKITHPFLNLYSNFSDEKAGCYVTFYVKTCFVNASSIFPLDIYNTSTNQNGILVPSPSSWKNLTLAPDITN